MTTFKRGASQTLVWLLVGATVGCDRMTKQLASLTLAGHPSRSFLADFIRVEYAENPGGFLGLGSAWPAEARAAVFGVATVLVLVGLLAVAMRHRWTGLPMVGTMLCVAGGASNWIDRVVRGRVVDFLTLGYGPIRTGIFNIADVAVLVGGILLLVGLNRHHLSGPPVGPVTSEP